MLFGETEESSHLSLYNLTIDIVDGKDLSCTVYYNRNSDYLQVCNCIVLSYDLNHNSLNGVLSKNFVILLLFLKAGGSTSPDGRTLASVQMAEFAFGIPERIGI